MTTYKNLSKESGILSYELGEDNITITFTDKAVYKYTTSSAGEDIIKEMQRLAVKGIGLNAYINNTKPKFASVL